METLATTMRAIDRINDVIGRAVSWMTLAMVLITFFVVVARYGFAWGEVWIQESYVWLHGIVFMVGAGYTLLHGGHVRVDVFYRPGSARHKAWVDIFGVVFLLMPMVTMVFWVALPYVQESWLKLEESREAGGLPGLFLLKTIILVFCILVAAQGISLAIRSILVLADHPAVKPADGARGDS